MHSALTMVVYCMISFRSSFTYLRIAHVMPCCVGSFFCFSLVLSQSLAFFCQCKHGCAITHLLRAEMCSWVLTLIIKAKTKICFRGFQGTTNIKKKYVLLFLTIDYFFLSTAEGFIEPVPENAPVQCTPLQRKQQFVRTAVSENSSK